MTNNEASVLMTLLDAMDEESFLKSPAGRERTKSVNLHDLTGKISTKSFFGSPAVIGKYDGIITKETLQWVANASDEELGQLLKYGKAMYATLGNRMAALNNKDPIYLNGFPAPESNPLTPPPTEVPQE